MHLTDRISLYMIELAQVIGERPTFNLSFAWRHVFRSWRPTIHLNSRCSRDSQLAINWIWHRTVQCRTPLRERTIKLRTVYSLPAL